MKPLFKNLVTPLRGTFLTLLFTVPQIPVGSLSSQKALAQPAPSCPVGTRLENLNWTQANFQKANFNQTLNLNGVNINFRMVENPPGIIKDISPQNSPGNLGAVPFGIAPGPYGGINKPYLRWGIDARGASRGGNATLIITADRPIVLGSPLLFLDVDRDRADETGFQDQITVTASNAGVNVPVILTPSAFNEVVGNVARGRNQRVGLGNAPTTSSAGNVAADFAGPVTTFQVIYQSGPLYAPPNPQPGQDETIGIATDISVCVPTAVGSIGDTVFNDRNGNNVQDADEPGIPGITVEVKDGNGNVINTATTDTNGKYRVPNLPAGQYTVSVTNPPNGFSPTLTQPNPITLTTGQNYDLADFGFRQLNNASIGDTVFNDRNGNNIQDPGEPGIPGIRVEVKDGNGNVVNTATTDANGKYRVPNLAAGQYTASVANPPNGFSPTLTQPNPINLTAGQNYDLADFGFRQPSNSSIGDTVYNDINGNKQQDANEPGIPNVVLKLTLPGNDGILGNDDDTSQTTTTNNNGIYNFNNLPAGNYRVAITPPANFTEITTGNPQVDVNLEANQSRTDVDFGLRRPVTGGGSIGDTVFSDPNDNGKQDAGEPGIPNVIVNLTLPGNDGILGNGDDTSQTTTTNDNGIYTFNNLPAGNYRVTVTPPANLPQITTGNPQVDVNLEANQSRTDVDFGFRRPGSGAAGDGDIFLVKRITAIASTNGQATQYNTFVDDPNDQNDNTLSPGAVGQYQAPTPVRSGDEVEYTIYFRTEQSLENINLCDLVPAGTTYVPNSISVTGGGTGADQGRFFPPLTPIEQIPESSVCENRNNPNGTVIVKLGNIPTTQSGFVRFRVKVD